MANARSIINQALRKIQVLGRGQTLPSDEATSALEALNGLLGSWSAEGATIYNSAREIFSLTGLQSYSIGVGGDFNTAKPIKIDAAFITLGGTDYQLTQVNAGQYAGIAAKYVSGTPEVFYFENDEPLGRIFLYPVGLAGYSLTLWSNKAITSFADLTTNYDLPAGFEDALVWNLAVRMAPEYEKEASLTVVRGARDSKLIVEGYIKRNNYPRSKIDVPTSGGGDNGNIYSGWGIR